jgi:hypothetical protein
MYTGIGIALEASGDGGGTRIDGKVLGVAEAIDSLRDDPLKPRAQTPGRRSGCRSSP